MACGIWGEDIKLDKCVKNTGITKNALRLRYRIMGDQIVRKTHVKCRNKYRLFIEINTGVLYGLALFYLFSYWSYYIIISIFGFTK
jgi:hypothetical protein